MGTKPSALRRFIQDANEHYKDHQGGTCVMIAVAVAGWVGTYFGLQLPGWACSVGFVLILFCLAAWSSWSVASKKAIELEEKRKPRLKLSAGNNVDGCVDGLTTSSVNCVYRLVVESLSDDDVRECKGVITKIARGSMTVFSGKEATLCFQPSEAEDSRRKTIRPRKKAYLDVLFVEFSPSRAIRLIPGTKHQEWIFPTPFDELFFAPDTYVITIEVEASGMITQSCDWVFEYRGPERWRDSKIYIKPPSPIPDKEASPH